MNPIIANAREALGIMARARNRALYPIQENRINLNLNHAQEKLPSVSRVFVRTEK